MPAPHNLKNHFMNSTNVIQYFDSFLDQIYYSGYADWAKEHHYEAYKFELEQFLSSHKF